MSIKDSDIEVVKMEGTKVLLTLKISSIKTIISSIRRFDPVIRRNKRVNKNIYKNRKRKRDIRSTNVLGVRKRGFKSPKDDHKGETGVLGSDLGFSSSVFHLSWSLSLFPFFLPLVGDQVGRTKCLLL